MKKILTLLFSIITFSLYSTIIPVTSPGIGNDIKTNLTAAITAASTNDIVLLPNGSFVLTNKITVNKQITIQGGGIGVTTLYRSETSSDANLETWGRMLDCTVDSIKILDITFKSKIPSADDGSDGLSMALDVGVRCYYILDFQIKRCRFVNFGNAGVEIIHRDSLARGLIAHCQFYHNAKGEDGQGLAYGVVVVYGESVTWIEYPKLGSQRFIFIEDNEFEFHRHSVASAGCALLVIRYNEFLNNIISGPMTHCLDAHDARGPGHGVNTLGTRAMEIYNNTIVNNVRLDGVTPLTNGLTMTSVCEKAIGIKAGDAIVYNNTISGYRFGVTLKLDYETGVYPYTSQTGWISGSKYGSTHKGTYTVNKLGYCGPGIRYTAMGDGDLFYWNNTFTPYVSSPVTSTNAFYNYDPTWFVLERDYHAFKKLNYRAYTYPHPNNN